MSGTVEWTLDWFGDQHIARMDRACQIAVMRTGAAIVAEAKRRVRVDTHTLQGSIQLRGPEMTGMGWSVRVGSFNVAYAIWQEIGTRKMSAQPYLRPSMEEQGNLLLMRLKAAYALAG